MSAAPARQLETAPDPKQQFLDVFEREHATTVKVLRAYPDGSLDLRPHRVCKTARELAWMFVMEQALIRTIVTSEQPFSSTPAAKAQPPATIEEIVTAFEKGHRETVEAVRALPAEKLFGTVKFFTAPKTIGDIPTLQFLWLMLHDQIHHRGQFSIYLRMADGRLPSIYGPTADEPWN
jgi:uncharacterized damage-inducible protein DinB